MKLNELLLQCIALPALFFCQRILWLVFGFRVELQKEPTVQSKELFLAACDML